MNLKANVVFVPGLVDIDQVEAIAEWISKLSREIPFNIMGYIPVPDQPYSRPTPEQMELAMNSCKRHLNNVSCSCISPEDAKNLYIRDDRFKIKVLIDTCV